MNKPKPEDFGLKEREVDQYFLLKGKLEVLGGSLAFIIGISAAFIELGYMEPWYNLNGFGDLATRIFAGFMFGAVQSSILFCISSIAIYGILWLSSKKYRNLQLYLKEKEKYEEWWNRTQEEFWRSLSGKGFEVELGSLYAKLGFDVHLTPSSGDGGIDLILKRGSEQMIVQCKAHKKPVGPAVVRELYGALINSKSRKAVLASISGFTVGVREFAKDKPIELVDLKDILKMQRQLIS